MTDVTIRLSGVTVTEVWVMGKPHFAITTEAGHTIIVPKSAVTINSVMATYFGVGTL